MSEIKSLEARREARTEMQRFYKGASFVGIVFNLTASALWGAYALDLIDTADTDNDTLNMAYLTLAWFHLFTAGALCIPYSYWSKQVKENS